MIKFFSINKKPKIYSIGIVSAIVLALILITCRQANPNYRLMIITLILYVAFIIINLIYSFIMQLKYNPYSYNSIYYIGFAIYFCIVLIILIYLNSVLDSFKTNNYDIFYNIVALITGSAKTYILLTSPIIIIFSIALIISNIVLIKHEGYSLTNILGIILSFLLIGGIIFIFFADYNVSGSVDEIIRYEIIVNCLSSIYLYFESMLIGLIIVNLIVINYKPDYNQDFIIILGCGLMSDGSPTPLLASRIDKALEFYHKQKQVNDKDIFFITSGGQGSDEIIAESTSMKNYLISKGIKQDKIIEENKSTNTHENMLFSKKIIDEINSNGNILFSTNNFHVFRSGINATRVKMKAIGIGSSTKWYFWPNADVREFVGLLSQHRLKQSIILGSMIIFNIIMTIVLYANY